MISLKEQVVRLHKELCVKEDEIKTLKYRLEGCQRMAKETREYESKTWRKINAEIRLIKEENQILKQIKNQ